MQSFYLKAKTDPSFFIFSSGILPSGDIAALVYLWNPFTIVCCVGLSTSPIENMAVILALNGAVTRKKIMILGIFDIVNSCLACYTYFFYLCRTSSSGGIWFSHGHTFISLSCYSDYSCMSHFRDLCISWSKQIITLLVRFPQVIFLLGYGLDAPPLKLFLQTRNVESDNRSSTSSASKQAKSKPTAQLPFLWRTVVHFVFWVLVWSLCVLVLCGLSLSKHGGLEEMFKR